jgi:hypothetical protein
LIDRCVVCLDQRFRRVYIFRPMLIMADMPANAGYYDNAVKLLENGIPIVEQPDLLRSKLANVEARRRGGSVD